MHSYFWLVSSRLKKPVHDDVPYTTQALRENLLRVQNAWDESQARRERDAIYTYLTAVFELVAWWMAENRALERAQKALRLRHINPFDHEEPFAAVIRCTADREKVDKRTRSKWSRALRYALEYKDPAEPLETFIKRKGGINRCAERLPAHQRSRPSRLLSSE
jgi:DNA-binding PucR family transcriptional regulator